MKTTPQFTQLEVEAAQCCWEYVDNHTCGQPEDLIPTLLELRQAIGAVEFRSRCIDLGRYCLAVYDHIPEDARDGHSWDWDIIPAILDTFKWDRTGTEPPHTAQQCAAIVAKALTEPDPRPTTEREHCAKIDALRTIQLRATKARVIAEMRALRISEATVTYSSLSGKNPTATVALRDLEQNPFKPTNDIDYGFYSIETLINRFAMDLVAHQHDGFQTEGGCRGYITIKADAGTVAIEHSTFELNEVSQETTF